MCKDADAAAHLTRIASSLLGTTISADLPWSYPPLYEHARAHDLGLFEAFERLAGGGGVFAFDSLAQRG